MREYYLNPKIENRIVYADLLKGIDSSWSMVEKAKYIYDQICRVSSYDERFIFSTDPELLQFIYNRKVDVDRPMNPKLICKSLNEIYQELLSRVGIRSKIIKKPSKMNKLIESEDIALLFYDESGNAYYTNVAADLQRSKYKMKSFFFGECDRDNQYQIEENITILSDEELKDIDIKTGHLKKDGMYSDEVFEMIASEVQQGSRLKGILYGLPDIVRKYLNSIGIENVDDMSNEELNGFVSTFTMEDFIRIKMMLLNYVRPNDETYGPIESKKHSKTLFRSMFNKTEKKYYSCYDMIKEQKGKPLEVISIIQVRVGKEYIYYRYSQETHKYELLSSEEAAMIRKDYRPYQEEPINTK